MSRQDVGAWLMIGFALVALGVGFANFIIRMAANYRLAFGSF